MQCSTCGAPLTDAAVAAGACHFCRSAVAAPAPAPSLEGAVANLLSAVTNQVQAGGANVQVTTIVIEGKAYQSLAEIPADVRARNADKIAKLERLGLLR
jgi:hypothetical protein